MFLFMFFISFNIFIDPCSQGVGEVETWFWGGRESLVVREFRGCGGAVVVGWVINPIQGREKKKVFCISRCLFVFFFPLQKGRQGD